MKSHQMSGTHEYKVYTSAKRRCNNPKDKGYKNYGGRGIKFLFTNFEQFFAELGYRPEGLLLDRENNEGHYAPGNVRWVTRSIQNLNRRKRTHCFAGHKYVVGSFYTDGDTNRRICKRCSAQSYQNKRGARPLRAKLNVNQVVRIRNQYAAGVTKRLLADRYGVHRITISRIVNNKGWRKV